jgi:hypothetical protein
MTSQRDICLTREYRFNSPNYNLSKPTNYDEATQWFIDFFERSYGLTALKTRSITSVTSDYALYWFDWLAGFNIILAQFGWNHTLIQDIALVRGAARMQNKSWGAIISWKYDEPPYLDSGEAIYRQMLMTYEAGAKYIAIFNYPKINDYGIIADEHFEALKNFWNDVCAMPQTVQGSIKAEAALVLPRNYGWGMRQPNDRIWGWWGTDEKAPQIWALSRQLLSQYELLLDIVYEDPAFPVKSEYQKIYYWNYTIIPTDT